MPRLLNKPIKQRPSKAEAAGKALTKLKMNGSLGVVDAAAFLCVHKYTLREHISSGKVATITIGKRKYLEENELYRLKELIGEFGSLGSAFRNKSQKDTDNA
jgi:hypothetical protein